MPPIEREEALAFTRAVLARELGQEPRIFPVSARLAPSGGAGDDLARLKEHLHPQLLADFNQAIQRISGRHGHDLAEAFERAARHVIERAIEGWRAEAEPKLWARAEALTATYTRRVDQLVERLFAVSRDLFGLPGLGADPLDRLGEPPAFEFRWVEHVPTSSGMLARAVVGRLPAPLARPFVARASRRRLALLLDVQLGWSRHDLDRRITAWVKALRAHVDGRLAAAREGIEGALERGSRARDAGAEALDTHLRQLADVELLGQRYR